MKTISLPLNQNNACPTKNSTQTFAPLIVASVVMFVGLFSITCASAVTRDTLFTVCGYTRRIMCSPAAHRNLPLARVIVVSVLLSFPAPHGRELFSFPTTHHWRPINPTSTRTWHSHPPIYQIHNL
jgi:hypothetical protein